TVAGRDVGDEPRELVEGRVGYGPARRVARRAVRDLDRHGAAVIDVARRRPGAILLLNGRDERPIGAQRVVGGDDASTGPEEIEDRLERACGGVVDDEAV